MPTRVPWNKLILMSTSELLLMKQLFESKSNPIHWMTSQGNSLVQIVNNIRKGSNTILRQIQVEIDRAKKK